jgi:F-type H+-transporting ATPase subunit b
MQLQPDLTLLFQVAIFIVVWLGLKTLVFTPMQRVLAERERRTTQAEESARAVAATAGSDRTRYEDALREQRQRMMREAELARHASIEDSNQRIAAARAEIGRELARHRAEVASQVETARRSLAAEAAQVAAEMLARVSTGGRA